MKILFVFSLLLSFSFPLSAHPQKAPAFQATSNSFAPSLSATKKAIDEAHSLDPIQRKEALFTTVLHLDRWLRNDPGMDAATRWEILSLMSSAVKDGGVLDAYEKRFEKALSSHLSAYETTTDPRHLIEVIRDYPLSRSGHIALGKLADFHFSKKNYILTATYLDLLSQFRGRLTVDEKLTQLHAHAVIGSRDFSKWLEEFESEHPEGGALGSERSFTENLKKLNNEPDLKTLEGVNPSKWKEHYVTSDRLGNFLKKRIQDQSRLVYKYVAKKSPAISHLHVGHYVSGIDETGSPLLHTGRAGSEPVRFQQSEKIKKVVSGEYTTCALTVRGRINCQEPHHQKFTQGNYEAVDVCATDSLLCMATKKVWCTLSNGSDQLFNRFFMNKGAPAAFAELNRKTEEEGGISHLACRSTGVGDQICAATHAKNVHCVWMGHDRDLRSYYHGGLIPMPEPISSLLRSENIRQISSGLNRACALTGKGRVVCWGEGSGISLAVEKTLEAERGAVHISMNEKETCAISNDHKLYCWDYNGRRIQKTHLDERIQEFGGALEVAHSISANLSGGCVKTVLGVILCWTGTGGVSQVAFDGGRAEEHSRQWLNRWSGIGIAP